MASCDMCSQSLLNLAAQVADVLPSPRYETRPGSASLAETNWSTWSAWVKYITPCGVASRSAWTGQIGQGFENHLAALTLHGFSFSHAIQTRLQRNKRTHELVSERSGQVVEKLFGDLSPGKTYWPFSCSHVFAIAAPTAGLRRFVKQSSVLPVVRFKSPGRSNTAAGPGFEATPRTARHPG